MKSADLKPTAPVRALDGGGLLDAPPWGGATRKAEGKAQPIYITIDIYNHRV